MSAIHVHAVATPAETAVSDEVIMPETHSTTSFIISGDVPAARLFAEDGKTVIPYFLTKNGYFEQFYPERSPRYRSKFYASLMRFPSEAEARDYLDKTPLDSVVSPEIRPASEENLLFPSDSVYRFANDLQPG